jgi:hypothetical protein
MSIELYENHVNKIADKYLLNNFKVEESNDKMIISAKQIVSDIMYVNKFDVKD